jgi:asparagine synthase (glutamine-hydrolysing)
MEDMCDRIAHRGPDGTGYFYDQNAALGHRRLSIIDVSGGAQPLGNEDGSVQIVFNGEIYNYLELRSRLIERGHRFTTNSDTETMVHLYEEEGERTPEFLNGMFALAIWDARKRELFLARDRFGKKPLYYATGVPGFALCFASELKALAAVPNFSRQTNYRSVADFLAFSYVPQPDTIYEGALQVPAGHMLTLGAGGIRLRRYWAPRFGRDESARFEDRVEELRTLAADSVKRRMLSDVPLGAFLSGGVDSSAAVAYMATQSSERIKTFSIGFTKKEFDELEFARLVAKQYETEHHEEVVSPSVHEMLGTYVDHFDEPFGDASSIPTLYLSRMTRKNVTVALSGDGADEIFGGYRRYYYGALEERLRRRFPRWFRKSVFRWAGRYYPKFDYLPQVFRGRTLLGNLAREIGDAYFTSMTVFRDDDLACLLAPDAISALNGYSPRERYCERFERVKELSPLQQMQAVDFETYLVSDILVKADRATMAFSLESRSPWLDYRLAELAGSMPDWFKIKGTSGKHIMKKAVEPLLPQEILTRKKMGFATPLGHWFRTSLKPTFEALVMRPEMEQYVRPGEVKRIWLAHQSGYHDYSRKLWNLLVLAAWERRHRAADPSTAALAAGQNALHE